MSLRKGHHNSFKNERKEKGKWKTSDPADYPAYIAVPLDPSLQYRFAAKMAERNEMQNHAERDKHGKLQFKHALTPEWERNFHGTNAIAINFTARNNATQRILNVLALCGRKLENSRTCSGWLGSLVNVLHESCQSCVETIFFDIHVSKRKLYPIWNQGQWVNEFSRCLPDVCFYLPFSSLGVHVAQWIRLE